uniref:Dynein regulatory complex protein 10 n=1 Tax=Myripristis murdjan TaxID=586833 RepID=A0A667YUQ7_9TELE
KQNANTAIYPLTQTISSRTTREALKILETSRKKLPSLEAQRFSGVLEDSISQVEIVAMLPAVLARLDTLSGSLDSDLSGALREHRLLEERLMSLDGPGSDGGQEGESREARERVRAQLEKDIQSSVMDVLRLFRAHPDAVLVLRAEVDMEAGASKNVQPLIDGLKKFHDLMLEKLLTSPEEEQQLSAYMKEMSLRRDHNMKLMASLEAEVAAAKKKRDLEVSHHITFGIKTLKRSLYQMNKKAEDFISQMEQDADRQSQSISKTSEQKQIRMRQEIDQLNVQLNNLILENREAERVLREVEYNQIQEERWLAEERRKEEQRNLELKTRAAILAQAWWRGYCVRKAMKSKGKSKKGKKGKGKKGN